MNLCEMKYAQDEYTITRKYSDTIRERTSLFKKQMNTKKALRCTFVTTYGVKENSYSDIVDNQVSLEDLFR